MLTFEEALGRLLEGVQPTIEERVPVGDADGRVMARDLIARTDLPPYDYSAMDGYAIRSSALQPPGPWKLAVRGESRTGAAPPDLEPGCACRIFTGAHIPAGADAVVMQEDVARDGDEIVLARDVRAGSHIRRRADDMAAGTTAIAAGTRLGPGHLALAASVDAGWVWVSRRPVVTIVSTGDELRYPGEPEDANRLPESVSVAIKAMAARAGAFVRVAPFAPDDPASTAKLITDAMRGTDLLITIGGVSVGEHDVVRPALEASGVQIEFWRVKVKPGKPIAVGRGPAGRVLGLPGNPTSAQVSFALFGMPLLRAMQRDSRPTAARIRARLLDEVHATSDRTEFLRGSLHMDGSRLVARPLRNQASGATTSMAMSDCLLVIPAESSKLAAGSEVDVIRLSDV
ncbi:MAG: molybdopterin molybdotransferase MoeA [Deltaproteobacteria bacterium]|nr:molybdopterin molybdotransferase MoeA [Deltaproteobacteria bacterium]